MDSQIAVQSLSARQLGILNSLSPEQCDRLLWDKPTQGERITTAFQNFFQKELQFFERSWIPLHIGLIIALPSIALLFTSSPVLIFLSVMLPMILFAANYEYRDYLRSQPLNPYPDTELPCMYPICISENGKLCAKLMSTTGEGEWKPVTQVLATDDSDEQVERVAAAYLQFQEQAERWMEERNEAIALQLDAYREQNQQQLQAAAISQQIVQTAR